MEFILVKLQASLHCTECNSTIYWLCHIDFLEYLPEISCLKRNILREKSVVDEPLNKLAILLKREPKLDLFKEARRFWCIYRKTSSIQTFFGKVAGLESISAILLKALQWIQIYGKRSGGNMYHFLTETDPTLKKHSTFINSLHLSTLICNSSLLTSM